MHVVFGHQALRRGDDMGLHECRCDDYAYGLEEEGGCEGAARFGGDEARGGEGEAAEEEEGD